MRKKSSKGSSGSRRSRSSVKMSSAKSPLSTSSMQHTDEEALLGLERPTYVRLKSAFEEILAKLRRTEEGAIDKSLTDISEEDLRAALMGQRLRIEDVPALSSALFPLADAEKLTYPCVASAFLDYFATGEGHTMGMLVMTANTVSDLRSAAINKWGEYFAQFVEVRSWQGVPKGYEWIYPGAVEKLLNHAYRSSFEFTSTMHFNAA